ncbi:amidase family protein [Haloglycomyces albus]|uniref:amidase family protein n=1 Tax=Haloglycomyces albus TaxID=526067 RepID=UPI0004AFDCE8|nr:amidase family protein [Haloglycomyces albus]
MTWAGATAQDIATAVRRNDATAVTILHDHLEHFKRQPGNAIHHLRYDDAVTEAQLIDALESSADTGTSDGSAELFPAPPTPVPEPDRSALPAAGVPVISCQQLPIAGQESQLGSNATTVPSAERDHEAVNRFKGAGALIYATGHSSELGLWPATDQPGQIVNNPHHPYYSPAGPSGGLAAAVSLGTAPIGIGLDGPATAGGVRTAAAACGLFAYSPEIAPTGQYDRTKDANDRLSHKPGVIATTAGDLALAVSTLTNSEHQLNREPTPLRMAATTYTPMPGKADDDNTELLLNVVRELTGGGHDVQHAKPDWGKRLPTVSSAVWATAAYERSRQFRALQRRTRHLATVGAGLRRRGTLTGLLGQGERARRHMEDWFAVNNFEALLTPALPGPPPFARSWSEATLRANINGLASAAAYSAPASVTGLPAVTVPISMRHDGLPAGVQIIGPAGSTERLLQIARILQAAFAPRRHAKTVSWD